jgi:alpha-L-fucosidase
MRALAAAAAAVMAAAAAPPAPNDVLLRWMSQEVTAMVSFDMISVLTNVSNAQHFCIGVGGDPGAPLPPPTTFNLTSLDTDQWAQVAASFGASYIVFTTMHCSGFAMWPTAMPAGINYTYNVANSGTPVDIVEALFNSTRKAGIGLGTYYSLNFNRYCDASFAKVLPPSNLLPGMLNLTQDQYTAVALAMQVEVWSKYAGQLQEIWFDGGDDMPGVNEALAQFQPQVRCGGGGGGVVCGRRRGILLHGISPTRSAGGILWWHGAREQPPVDRHGGAWCGDDVAWSAVLS